jgi:ABC-type branched-subunit amino acid transport system ATPase component
VVTTRQDTRPGTCDQRSGPVAIACSGLTKDYGHGRGVFDLDLSVRRGETFGFIGPNGAGKPNIGF